MCTSTLQNLPYMPGSLSGLVANKALKRRTLISDTRNNNNQVARLCSTIESPWLGLSTSHPCRPHQLWAERSEPHPQTSSRHLIALHLTCRQDYRRNRRVGHDERFKAINIVHWAEATLEQSVLSTDAQTSVCDGPY